MASRIRDQYEQAFLPSYEEAESLPSPFKETPTWIKIAFYVPVIGQIASWYHQLTLPPSNNYSAHLIEEDIELQHANVIRNVSSIVMAVSATIFSGFITAPAAAPLLLTGTVLLAGAIVSDVNCIIKNYDLLKHYSS